MFTGLIEEVGTVEAASSGVFGVRRSVFGPAAQHRTPNTEHRTPNAIHRLVIQAPRVSSGTAVGDSVCVNGVCLTVVAHAGTWLEFEAVAETLRRSSLGDLRAGDPVNLERAMLAGSRFGGHIVQGHVDGVGTIARIVPETAGHRITVAAPAEIMRYVVEKGSIAMDGISLTVAGLSGSSFDVAIIPHTWAETTVGRRKPGDRVNLEVDLLAKYVERLLEARWGARMAAPESGGLTESLLRERGFA